MNSAHVFTHFRSLGGVQSLLKRHHAGDAGFGLDSSFTAFFDPVADREERVAGLGLTWRQSIAEARRRWRALNPCEESEIVAYHNCWGLPFVAGIDRAQRRVGVLHSDWPDLDYCLGQMRPLLDGMLCVSPTLVPRVRAAIPELGEDRVGLLPLPAGRDAVEANQPPIAGRPFVLGFCGRVTVQQKRVDLFPELCRLLDSMGVDYRLEFLGEGDKLPWVRHALGASPRVAIHGRLSGDRYWKVVRGWDAVVFLSEYEGLPLSLLEALSVGAIPVYPTIDSGADQMVSRLGRGLLYPAGDLGAAARAIADLTRTSQSGIDQLRDECGKLVTPHLGDGYLRTFAGFCRSIAQAPRVSLATSPPRPGRLTDRIPFGLLRRLSERALWKNDLPEPAAA